MSLMIEFLSLHNFNYHSWRVTKVTKLPLFNYRAELGATRSNKKHNNNGKQYIYIY